MTKRKADIFTVAESVPNWFANSYTVAPPEEVKGVVTNHPEINPVTHLLTATVQPTVAEAVADWAKTSPHTWLSAVGSYAAASWSEVEQVGREPADGAGTGHIGVATQPGPPTVAEVAGTEGLGQHAFWSLLRAAGYEVW